MIFLVYKTDCHHSYASRDIIGIATALPCAIDLCLEKAAKEDEELSSEQLWNLGNITQTQNYSGEGEFQIEEVETDILL